MTCTFYFKVFVIIQSNLLLFVKIVKLYLFWSEVIVKITKLKLQHFF